MSGQYFNPVPRIYLNLSGGTVTGDTIFTENVQVQNLTATTIFSGSSNIESAIVNLVSSVTGDFLSVSGGTGGSYDLVAVTADTITILNEIEPQIDDSVDLGSSIKRFRNLNTINGIAVNFTASTKIVTQHIELGNEILTDTNIILSGYTIDGGDW